MIKNKKALLWTGGKDCCLVLHLLNKKVDYLVTLVPKGFDDYSFKAHPIYIIKEQAKKLNIPLLFVEVTEPYDDGYKQAFLELKAKYAIKTVYSGDIEYIGYSNNIIESSCQANKLNFIRPLWKKERMSLMKKMLAYKIQAQITWSNNPDYQNFLVGKVINQDLIEELRKLPIDLSGEAGEYHTMVVDCLLFNEKKYLTRYFFRLNL